MRIRHGIYSEVADLCPKRTQCKRVLKYYLRPVQDISSTKILPECCYLHYGRTYCNIETRNVSSQGIVYNFHYTCIRGCTIIFSRYFQTNQAFSNKSSFFKQIKGFQTNQVHLRM